MEATPNFYRKEPPAEGLMLRTVAYVPISSKHGATILPQGLHGHIADLNHEPLLTAPLIQVVNSEASEGMSSDVSMDKPAPSFNVSIKKRYSKIDRNKGALKGDAIDVAESRRAAHEDEVRALIKKKLDLRSFAMRKITKPIEEPQNPSTSYSCTPSFESFKEDCDRIETVFLNCNRRDEPSRATNLNILIKLYHLVSSGGGTDWKPRGKDAEDLQTCLLAVKTLHLLLVRGGRFDEGDRTAVIAALSGPTILETLIESMYFIDMRFLGDNNYMKEVQKLHSQILEMIVMICKANPSEGQLVRASEGTVQLIGKLTSTCSNNKDLAGVLLEALKIISRTKRNCRNLTSKQFFDGLCTCCNLTSRMVTTTKVLQAMSKDKPTLDCMSENENVVNLIFDIIYYNGKKALNKRPLFNILSRMLKSGNEKTAVSADDIFNKLYQYFLKSEKCNHRSETIKAYTFLNRISNPTILHTTKLNADFCLPEHVKKCMAKEELLEEDETDDSEEEQDDDVDVDVDDDDDESDESEPSAPNRLSQLSSPPALTREEKESLSDMSSFYMEHLLNSEGRDYSNLYDFEIYEGIPRLTNRKVIENRVYRGVNMDQIAYPDAAMLEPEFDDHTLSSSVNNFSVKKLIQKLKCVRDNQDNLRSYRVVYDLDELQANSQQPTNIPHPSTYSYNPDKNARSRASKSCLKFESRFECGNLRRAVQIGKFEYELTLSPDTNTTRGLQWFYFQVTNMVPKTAYVFNIINFLKPSSQYNHGMQPVIFSVVDHVLHKTGWKRGGRDIVYYGNNYINEDGTKQYQTLSFSVSFQYSNDYVYLAYHYPYTYTRLMIKLFPLVKHKTSQVYARIDKLCKTANNKNEVALLTITGAWNRAGSLKIPFTRRPVIFITARVHPGETNSSWIMEGIIKFLLNETDENAITAREHFVFKIIPMLNPEGVIYGNTVCGLTGANLNRSWMKPSRVTCPEIYQAKRLIACGKHVLRLPIAAYIDIHGHSQRKFFFFYGCNPQMSWSKGDKEIGDFGDIVKLLPEMVHNTNPNISLTQCRYKIDKSKEGSGRVVMWREFDIKHSFTLECSYSFANEIQAINTKILTNIGASVVSSLGKIADKVFMSKGSISSLSLDYSCNFRAPSPLHNKRGDAKATPAFFSAKHNFEDSGIE